MKTLYFPIIVCGVMLLMPSISKADFSDNFEDGIINPFLWETGGRKSGSWSYSHQEVWAGDGYLEANVNGPTSGITYGAEAWIRTRYDFNNGRDWLINFKWRARRNAYHTDRFFIQIGDDYFPTDPFFIGTDHWIETDDSNRATLFGVRMTGDDRQFYMQCGGLFEADLSKFVPYDNPVFSKPVDWSIRIDSLNDMATLYEGPDGTGRILAYMSLDSSPYWFIRFFLSDYTSAGFPAGDNSLYLYSFSAEEVTREQPPDLPITRVAYHSYSKYSLTSDDPWDSRLYLLDLTTQTGDWVSDLWGTIDNPMNPHFSPDGTQIVFMAVPKGQHSYYNLEIYLWTINGGEPKRLTNNTPIPDEDPKFCPDGRIVFKRSGRIHIINSDGTGARRLTENSFEESMPYYTKDGTNRILYASGIDENADIRIVNEDGTNDDYVERAHESGIQEYYPIAWFDKMFLYTRWIDDEASHHDQIYSCEIDNQEPPQRLSINKFSDIDYSDPYPINRDYILFSRWNICSSYDLYIGNVSTGDAWPIDLYGGENTHKWEIGAACWPANISSEIHIEMRSHADLHVYDPERRHTGINYMTNTVEESIPGSDFKILDEGGSEVPYDGSTPGEGLRQVITLSELQAGTYLIELVGTSDGPFCLTVSGVQDGFTMTSQRYEGNIVRGVRLSTEIKMISVLDALTLIWEEQFALQLEPVMDFKPDTLNLDSRGKFVTVYIELPQGFEVSQIDVSSLLLNDSVPALSKPVEIGDYDGDGIADLMVKFERQQVANTLEPGEQLITIIGRLFDGTPFSGMDIIRVIGNMGDEIADQEIDSAMPKELLTNSNEDQQTIDNEQVYESDYKSVDDEKKDVTKTDDEQQIKDDDSDDMEADEPVDTEEAAILKITEAAEIINKLGPDSFNDEESFITLTNQMNDVQSMFDEGLYTEALMVLENDILERTNGCAEAGQPDENDWIMDCEVQGLVYPLLLETTELLNCI